MSKGIELLLLAIQKMPAENIKYQLIIPTTPEPFFKEINALIEDLDIREKIELQHHLPFDQLKNEIANSNAIIIPSYSEGFCFAAVETMAIGTPIISSGKGALSEVISGKFIEMEDLSPSALQGAMMKALQGHWQETNPKYFYLKDTVDNYISLYQTTVTEI